MKKNLFSMLALTGVLILLIAWYFGYEKNIRKDSETTEENQKKLTALTRDKISEIEILKTEKIEAQGLQSETKQKIRLRKLDEKWRVIEPIDDLADLSAINTILSTLEGTKHERIIEETPKDLALYGLTEPELVVTLHTSPNDKPHVIRIGKDTPVGYSLYAIADHSDAVVRVARSVRSSLGKDLKDLRNRKLFESITRSDIQQIELQSGKTKTVLVLSEEKWTIANENLPADKTEVGKVLNAILNLKTEEFASENSKNLAAFGLNSPSFRLQILKKGDSRIDLIAAKKGGKIYAKLSDKDTIYEFKENALEKIDVKPEKLYDLTLASFNRFDIKRIRLDSGNETLELEKKDTKWSLTSDPQTEIDGSKVDEFLTGLQDMKIESYLGKPNPSMGLDKPVLRVTLLSEEENKEVPKVSLSFGKKSGKNVFVKREGFDRVLALSEEKQKKLILDKKSILKPKEAAEAGNKKES